MQVVLQCVIKVTDSSPVPLCCWKQNTNLPWLLFCTNIFMFFFRHWLLYSTMLWSSKTFWYENLRQSSAWSYSSDTPTALLILFLSMLSSRDWSTISSRDCSWLLCSRVRKHLMLTVLYTLLLDLQWNVIPQH